MKNTQKRYIKYGVFTLLLKVWQSYTLVIQLNCSKLLTCNLVNYYLMLLPYSFNIWVFGIARALYWYGMVQGSFCKKELEIYSRKGDNYMSNLYDLFKPNNYIETLEVLTLIAIL